MAREKKAKELAAKQHEQNQNAFEISEVSNSHFMTEDAGTTTSNLGGDRYVPYHFKGLRPDQKEQIMAERAQQIRDKQN